MIIFCFGKEKCWGSIQLREMFMHDSELQPYHYIEDNELIQIMRFMRGVCVCVYVNG